MEDEMDTEYNLKIVTFRKCTLQCNYNIKEIWRSIWTWYITTV